MSRRKERFVAAGRRWGAVAALALAACARGYSPPPGPPPTNRLEVALKRGASWTTFTLFPGKVTGSTVSLGIRRGEVRGFLNGSAVHLTVKQDEISGTVGGRVQVDIDEVDGKLEIGGTWNDERVHVEIAPDSLRGTITGVIEREFRRMPWSCQFVLDKTFEEGGVRTGTSICRGMPAETRLIFPRDVERWLTRGEAVTVLLALFASAPATSTD